jgi:4-diphosphocytidyl-2-C-methyl-D-erythritol kinase
VTGVGETIEPLPFERRRFVLLLPPLGVSTAAAYRAYDEGRGRRPERSASSGNDLEDAAVAVAPRLAAWRDRLAEVCGERPRLAGSGSTWFVEGGPEQWGLEGRDHLELDGERATLRAVRTLPPWPGDAER